MLDRLSSRELTEWIQFYAIRAEEDELRQRGLSADQIADQIASGEDEDDAVSGLLGALGASDALATERYLRSLEFTQDEADDGEDGDG